MEKMPEDEGLGWLPTEAAGENERDRPQPADEPIQQVHREDLLESMRKTIDQLETDQTSRGDLKILGRTLRELRYAFKVFREFRRRRKLTIFGSARTSPDHPAYQAAVALGRRMAEHGWMVITGAGGGIMEAGHRGAGRTHSMGLNIMLPFEQRANDYIDGDPKLVTLKYFFTRKLMFVKEAAGVVCLPGGFGTLDETLETLTLLQTGKQTMLPMVLLDAPGGTYWEDFGRFVHRELLSSGLISPEDLALYRITDSVETAVEEVLRFYRRYHSMRYVRDLLVLRLCSPLGQESIDQLNVDFADILVSGTITQGEALPEERSETQLIDLPRLILKFNRRNLGRLRMLIDRVNSIDPVENCHC